MNDYGKFLTRESRVVVIGLPRYGKTRLIRDTLTADAPRVIFHDITGHDYYAPGRLPLTIDDLESNTYLLHQEFCRLVIIAQSAGDPQIIRDEVRRLIALIQPNPGNCIVVFDEMQTHGRKDDQEINGLFAKGNHYGIVPIIAGQQATNLPLGARKGCSDAFVFGQHHPTELKEVFDCYGDVFAARVSQMRKGDRPLHWRESEREKWWGANARNKFRGNKAPVSGSGENGIEV